MQLVKPNSLVYGMWVRSTVKRHTGIPTCAGITPTKTLVKLANRLARKRDTNGVLLLIWPPPVRNRRAGRGRGHPRGPRGGEVAPAGLGGTPHNGAARYASLCARCGAQHINQGGCPGGGLAGRGRAYASHCGRFASAVSPRRGPYARAVFSGLEPSGQANWAYLLLLPPISSAASNPCAPWMRSMLDLAGSWCGWLPRTFPSGRRTANCARPAGPAAWPIVTRITPSDGPSCGSCAVSNGYG